MDKKKLRIASSEEAAGNQLYGDENLKPYFFKNEGTNKAIFINVLEKYYPRLLFPELHPPAWDLERWKTIEVKPSYTKWFPHKYWVTNPTEVIKGKWLMDVESQGENFE